MKKLTVIIISLFIGLGSLFAQEQQHVDTTEIIRRYMQKQYHMQQKHAHINHELGMREGYAFQNGAVPVFAGAVSFFSYGIPAIIVGLQEPKVNPKAPNSFMSIPSHPDFSKDYVDGYVKGAKKKRRKRMWQGVGISGGLIVGYILVMATTSHY